MKFVFKSLVLLQAVLMIWSGNALSQDQQSDSTMNEKILGLRTCLYVVPDLEAAKKWYAEAFGVDPYFDEPFYVGYNIGGYELGLLPAEKKQETGAENVVVYWGVDSVEKVFDAFREKGAEVHEDPHSVGEPLVVASVRDPWGNVIGFIYNPVFKLE